MIARRACMPPTATTIRVLPRSRSVTIRQICSASTPTSSPPDVTDAGTHVLSLSSLSVGARSAPRLRLTLHLRKGAMPASSYVWPGRGFAQANKNASRRHNTVLLTHQRRSETLSLGQAQLARDTYILGAHDRGSRPRDAPRARRRLHASRLSGTRYIQLPSAAQPVPLDAAARHARADAARGGGRFPSGMVLVGGGAAPWDPGRRLLSFQPAGPRPAQVCRRLHRAGTA